MAEQTVDRILVADCGSALTKVVLIEAGSGGYRLVAQSRVRSTHRPPWNDISLGVRSAVQRLEQTTGRQLLGPADEILQPRTLTDEGVDAFVAVASAGEPLRLVLAGLMEEMSLHSARQAAAATYTVVLETLSLSGGVAQRSLEARLAALFRASPEAVLLVGGTDGGAERPVADLIKTTAMALTALQDHLRPRLLFAGNAELRPQAAQILGVNFDLKSVDNVRPALDVENLANAQIELESLYLERKLSQLPGFSTLRQWTRQPVVPTAKSFAQTIRYLGAAYNLNVIGADVGSTATTVAVNRGQFHNATTRADVGVGLSLGSLVETVGLEAIGRWLPFELSDDDLRNFLANKEIEPESIPETFEETLLELAVAREALRTVAARARSTWRSPRISEAYRLPWDMVIGAGGVFSSLPHPVYAALLLLDGLEPVGVSTLLVDVNSLTGMLGALAATNPTAAATLAEADTLVRLGTVVAVAGSGRPGETAVRVKIRSEAGQTSTVKVPFGALELVPLGPDEKASLELRPGPRFDIGLGQWGKGARAEVEGGLMGLIIDARGRPLDLAADPAARREQLQGWFTKLGPASWEALRLMNAMSVESEPMMSREAA